MTYFVDVILPLKLKNSFTYLVSEQEFLFLKKGMRITVPFGKTKIYTALVLNLHQNKPQLYEAKPIDQILDEKPIVTESQIKLWHWIASYYMCTLGEVYKAALPNAMILESETMVMAQNNIQVIPSQLSDDEYLVYEALQTQTSLKIEEISKILNKKNVIPTIQKLLDKNILYLNEKIIEEYKPKKIKFLRLHKKYQDHNALNNLLLELSNAKKQKEAILSYFQLITTYKKAITVKYFQEYSKVSLAVLNGLVDKDVLEFYFLQEDRVFDENQDFINKNLNLSEAQNTAYQNNLNNFKKFNINLLHGVTASGKTEIYIKHILDAMENNQQSLLLLPEIALTTQLVQRLKTYFGNKIMVFHSKYNNNEKVEIYNNVLHNNTISLVIGVRSAIFLPFQNLGLVIIDEEHESNYKQTDPAPRYHARDVATVLTNFYQCKVLLGSATPSIESYQNVLKGKYGLTTLTQRFNQIELPEIKIIDLKDKYFRKQMVGHLSIELIDAIGEKLSLGEQIILFQNRRGFAPVLECTPCGHIPQCPSCDVSLTYHKIKNQLRCHYCGYAAAKPNKCYQCNSVELSTKGFGTEQIELEVASLFPTKKIIRLDLDTTKGKYAHNQILDQFKNQEADILIGTQMLAKGLDFENVSLVAILNADNMMYMPDFRAFEKSFQLMTQVAGRAGRSQKKGIVYIQTYNPNHPIIKDVLQNNFINMFQNQILEREIFKYPPFHRLIKITLKHKNYETLKKGSFWMHQVLSENLKIPVLGPEEPVVSRIKNLYIRNIIVKIPINEQLFPIKNYINRCLQSFETISEYKSIQVTINVDF
ncbi:MAG: replication restart helicase PriA [Flavobacterium sp.]